MHGKRLLHNLYSPISFGHLIINSMNTTPRKSFSLSLISVHCGVALIHMQYAPICIMHGIYTVHTPYDPTL